MRFLAVLFGAGLVLAPVGAHADTPEYQWPTELLIGRDMIREANERWTTALPGLSLVARDWGKTQLLAGELSLTDQARLTRSNRMLVGRLRSPGTLAPFAQVGVGQWRLDQELMPAFPRDVEIAAQLGGGFEANPTRTLRIGLQFDYTFLVRPQHEPQMICAPWLADGLLAVSLSF